MTPSVHHCTKCARGQDPRKPYQTWQLLGKPEKVLNCPRFRDKDKGEET
jgi:hypothetical protein